jgi:hypothetical protein
MGHGPFYYAQLKLANASCVWVLCVGDSVRSGSISLEGRSESFAGL